jgi:hypothetical protein
MKMELLNTSWRNFIFANFAVRSFHQPRLIVTIIADSSETDLSWMLPLPVNRSVGVGVGFAPILTRRRKKQEITTQNNEVAISMMLRKPVARITGAQRLPI